MSALTDALLKAGAPILKNLIEQSVGGIGGKIAGGVIDDLAGRLGTAATPEAITKEIETNPTVAAPIVQQVETDVARSLEAVSQSTIGYQNLLREDAVSQGILSRLWKPLFAICFTICYSMTVVTILWLMWTRQLGTLTQLQEITGFLTFAFLAGCAVLGVQIWQQKSVEK